MVLITRETKKIPQTKTKIGKMITQITAMKKKMVWERRMRMSRAQVKST